MLNAPDSQAAKPHTVTQLQVEQIKCGGEINIWVIVVNISKRY
jgi:hypothetical protein